MQIAGIKSNYCSEKFESFKILVNFEIQESFNNQYRVGLVIVIQEAKTHKSTVFEP